MNNFSQDQTIFSRVSPDLFAQSTNKLIPFPLENLDQDVANAYMYIDRIHIKLKAALKNPLNSSPAKQKQIKRLLYKTKTALTIFKDFYSAIAEI